MPKVAAHYGLIEDGAHATQEGLAPALVAHVIHLAGCRLVGVHARIKGGPIAGELGVRNARIGWKVKSGRALD